MARRPITCLLVSILATTLLGLGVHEATAVDDDPPGGTSTSSSGKVAPRPDGRLAAGAITFDEYAVGTTITTQYRRKGVVFSGGTFISNDGSNPTAPVLSGGPQFFGPITGTFTTPGTTDPAPVKGFTLDVGYIDNRDSVEVRYFDARGVRLGSVRAQALAINTIVVDYANIASFKVLTVSDEPAGFGIDNLVIRRGPAGIRPQRMASFGDSYSSGEGRIGDNGLQYDCATSLRRSTYREDTTVPYGTLFFAVDCDTRTLTNRRPDDFAERPPKVYENLCHRHARAYPNAIRQRLGIGGARGIFVACSGAETEDIRYRGQFASPGSPVNIAGGQTQLKTVEDWAAAGGDPDFITIGIGGNDAGFKSIITECMKKACSENDDYKAGVIDKIQGEMYDQVEDTYAALRRRFPNATIAAFGYPSIIGDPADDCGGYKGLAGLVRVEEPERRWLKRTVFTTLNQSLREAAAEAGVTFIDITPVTYGHEICSDQPWVNGLLGGAIGPDNESFHPNELAHDAIADWFMKHYTADGRLLFTNPEPEPPIDPGAASSISEGIVVARTYQGSEERACLQSCVITVQGSGYEPGASVPLRVRTLDGRAGRARRTTVDADLGTATADSRGRFLARLTLPSSVPPGWYTVDAAGTSPAGLPQYGSTVARVFATDPGSLRDVYVSATLRPGIENRAFHLRCWTTLPDARCGARIAVKAGRKVIARTRAGKGTGDQQTVVLEPRLSRREARRVWAAVAQGRRVTVVLTVVGSTGIDSDQVRVVRRLRRQ
jgi:lysophospholipase L1-like esterase